MTRGLLAFLLALPLATTYGQATLVDSMAVDVCACMTDSAMADKRDRASLCLLRVGRRYEARTVDRFGLNARYPNERRVLIDSLAGALSVGCPELANYANRPRRQEWSDAPAAPDFRFVYPPFPAAGDTTIVAATPPARGLTEAQLIRTFTGALDDLGPDGQLLLGLGDDTVSLYLPPKLRAQHNWVRLQEFSLRCERRVGPGNRLIWVVIEVVD